MIGYCVLKLVFLCDLWKRNKAMRNSPRLIVAAISFVSFLAVLCVTPSVQTWENISVDGLMRLRYILNHNQGKELCRDIAVIGIDSKTQDYYAWASIKEYGLCHRIT